MLNTVREPKAARSQVEQFIESILDLLDLSDEELDYMDITTDREFYERYKIR